MEEEEDRGKRGHPTNIHGHTHTHSLSCGVGNAGAGVGMVEKKEMPQSNPPLHSRQRDIGWAGVAPPAAADP